MQPPRRKRFQIHLSTAIVMMFVAGGITWLNTTPGPTGPQLITLDSEEATILVATGAVAHSEFYGWPAHFFLSYLNPVAPEFNRVIFFRGWMLVLDAALGLLTVIIAYVLCEWLIRRRAARKGA